MTPPDAGGLPRRRTGLAGGEDRWTSPGTRLAVAALLVSLVSLYFSWSADNSARRQADAAQAEAERRPLLEIAAVQVSVTGGLGGTETSGGRPRRVAGVRGALVDISLRNRGSGEAFVTSATILVQRAERLQGCSAIGGPLRVQADYTVAVPEDMDIPGTLTRETEFLVPSGGHGRFTLTVGPATTAEADPPWIAVVGVTLHEAAGRDLTLPPLALVVPGGDRGMTLDGLRWRIPPTRDRGCLRANAAAVATVTATPGVVAPNVLATLARALDPYR
ncbi:hypothetical protein ABGB17_01955 [Sphaerisporangium sp. B11E5]|uniref:hypothetical protein n=1 Tax=Sphaerisporangium sp. B11E5 TaxID=3153563 RepID=UPI00325D6698